VRTSADSATRRLAPGLYTWAQITGHRTLKAHNARHRCASPCRDHAATGTYTNSALPLKGRDRRSCRQAQFGERGCCRTGRQCCGAGVRCHRHSGNGHRSRAVSHSCVSELCNLLANVCAGQGTTIVGTIPKAATAEALQLCRPLLHALLRAIVALRRSVM
jgi:hypothetical protein